MRSAATDTAASVLVYRMEHPSGVGPFQAMSWDLYEEFTNLHPLRAESFPTPPNDDELRADPHWPEVADTPGAVFGCCSLDTLREWFPPQTIPLLETGDCVVTVWRVPADAVAQSKRQALFVRDRAEEIERRPAADLHKSDDLPLAA